MKMNICRCLFLVFVTLFYSTAAMGQNTARPMQAELKRSTTGRGYDASGMATIPVPLPKGAIYDLVKQGNGSVLLSVDGRNVMVETSAVLITEKPQMAAANSNGFVPGKIVLISAKYTLEGNQPRNVKNNLQKLIPQTLVAPVEIIVTDALSSAAQDEGQSRSTIVVTGDAVVVSTTAVAKNVLTVQYMYNGQRFTKQVAEGGKLVLP